MGFNVLIRTQIFTDFHRYLAFCSFNILVIRVHPCPQKKDSYTIKFISEPLRNGKTRLLPYLFVLVLLQYPLCHRNFVNFIRTVVYAGGAFMPIVKGQNGIIGHPQPAVDLQRTVDDFLHHIGHHKFDQGNLFTGLFFADGFDPPGGMQHHQTGCLDVGRTLADP